MQINKKIERGLRMKKVKGLVVLGSFIFINSVGFAAYVTDTQFNALKNHYNNFGKSMRDWTDKTSGEINTININVTNLNNQVTTLNNQVTTLNTQFNQAMSSINDNALVTIDLDVSFTEILNELFISFVLLYSCKNLSVIKIE